MAASGPIDGVIKGFLKQFFSNRNILVLSNVLLVFFFILLSNAGVLPVKNSGDFVFFAVLVLAFALYRPGWSFLFFVGTVALENINLAPEALGIAVRPYQFFGALTLLAVFVRLGAGRLNFKLPKPRWYDCAVMFFVAGGFLNILRNIVSSDVNAGFFPDVKQSIAASSFAALYFLTRIFVQNFDDLKKITPFFLSSSVVVIFYGFWQNISFMRGFSHFETMPGRPNSTFAEADWLGIYLVLVLAVLYSLVYYVYGDRDNKKTWFFGSWFSDFMRRWNFIGTVFNQVSNLKYKFFISLLFLSITSCYALLVLTVSRGAWLAVLVISAAYQLACFRSFVLNNGDWRGFFKQILFLAAAGIAGIVAIFVFNLTNFQLFNRAQSVGTGLQKITVSCQKDILLPEKISANGELIQYDCRHINLEEIGAEKELGNFIKETYRPDPNIGIRRKIYQKSWLEIKSNPFFGIGWKNIERVLGEDARGAGLNSSNIFLEVWLGAGLIGLISLAAFAGYFFIRAFLGFFRVNDILTESILLFIIIGSIGLLAANMFSAGLFLGILWLFFGLIIRTNIDENNWN